MSGTKLFVLRDGKLVEKQLAATAEPPKTISYTSANRATPDSYHTSAIKQYRKELDEMRKNYYELQRAYWYLLGYRPAVEQENTLQVHAGNTIENIKNINEVSTVQSQSSNKIRKGENLQELMLLDLSQNKIKIVKLTESIVQYQAYPSARSNEEHYQYMVKSDRTNIKTALKMKTEQSEDFDENLSAAAKQITSLKYALENANQDHQEELLNLREDYQQHIKKLQQILERERKQTKKLNESIVRLRSELQSKDKFLKSVMQLKNSQQSHLQKLTREFKKNLS